MKKFSRIYIFTELIKNMGLRYICFRVIYVLKRRIGYLKLKFPSPTKPIQYVNHAKWRENAPSFLFSGKEIKGLEKAPNDKLLNVYQELQKGIFTFFGHEKLLIGSDYNWITNPKTGYQYDIKEHWSMIEELSSKNGDIKYVWEKSRFTFLMDTIRYDYHFEKDQSKFTFSEIESFIDHNPINFGPNYICSQEISLRVLNWIFALYYYKDSATLNDKLFNKILNSIYWQILHVFENINFSRISVRNNHAVTETLLLYISSKIFPFFPESKEWGRKGKKWFQDEIKYQVYEDGTHLQFSTNYHRVVIQLMSFACRMAEIHNDKFDNLFYLKCRNSFSFLYNLMDRDSGELPNLGANDGALFFKLSNNEFGDYRPQLSVLATILYGKTFYNCESLKWFGFKNPIIKSWEQESLKIYKNGGYIILNDSDNSKTVLKCSSYRNRPSQADNNHLDIWVSGKNYLIDNGSYLYNTEPDIIEYFNGVYGHNSCSINKMNQMTKGPRFIWFDWIRKSDLQFEVLKSNYFLNGNFEGFAKLNPKINHNRSIRKECGVLKWQIIDTFQNADKYKKQIYWHSDYDLINDIELQITDLNNKPLKIVLQEGKNSKYYGKFRNIPTYTSETDNGFITTISIKHK